ncbi:hypothetical protein ACFL3C_04315 [Patescibacteria group bacterium]
MAETPDRTSTMPVFGTGDPDVWKDFIEATDRPNFVLIAAEQLAENHLSVTEPTKERAVNCSFTRVELIFYAFKRYLDLPHEDSELKEGLKRINELLDKLIENGSLSDLGELGILLLDYKRFFPTDMWSKTMRKIFEMLRKAEDTESTENIERISQEVESRKDGVD